jgi:hypothetical protein
MKKLLFLAMTISMALILPAERAHAQQLPALPLISTGNSLAKDTVTNTGNKILMLSYRGAINAIGITVDVTKISGTLGGTLIPVCSNDGVNFYAAGSGTLTVTDVAAQGTAFSPPLGFAYYGVKWTGTGTMSGSFIAKINGK